MRLIHFAIKNVLRRKTRSALAAFSVASAVAATITLIGFASGFEAAMQEAYDSHDVDLLVVRTGVAERLTSSLDATLGDRLAQLPHVRAINPSLTDLASLGEGSLTGIPVRGWPPNSFVFDSLKIVAGGPLAETDHKAVFLGARLAEALKKHVGDMVQLENAAFHVVGIYQGANMYEDTTAVVALADLQLLMDRPGQVTEFELMLDRPITAEKIKTLSAQIESLKNRAGDRHGLTAIAAHDYVGSSTEIRMAHALSWAVTAIAMAIGCVTVLNTMSVSVLERTQEIGLLRAVGWRRRRVMWMILCEAELIAAAGMAAGLVIAMICTPLLARLPMVEGMIRPTIAPLVVLVATVLAGALGLTGSAIPSYRATQLHVSDALRYDAI
jgi:putative ABC transport system permease protein